MRERRSRKESGGVLVDTKRGALVLLGLSSLALIPSDDDVRDGLELRRAVGTA